MLRKLGALAVSAFAGICAHADVVLDWNQTLMGAIRVDKTAPPIASRAMSLVHTAVYDAVNSVDRSHMSYVVDTVAPLGTSREAAAAQAAFGVLSAVFPGQQATFDAALASSLSAIPDGQSKTDGIALGSMVSSQLLAHRAGDGWDQSIPYTPGTNPGDWRPTGPGFLPALLPHWGTVTPWAMPTGATFRPPPPPALTSAEYTAAYNEVKELGSKTSATRTADQTEIANFWADGPGTETPPGHWNAIARDVAATLGNDISENARLFALLNLGAADAAIISWDAKFEYNHWRPYTGIREGDTDGNADTDADASWEPLITTPPFPAYTSGHSTFSGAASSILAGFFGTDEIAFSTDSDALPGVLRSFLSFSEAAEEAGQSRIYGGIHWQYDNQFGLSSGRSLGDYVLSNYLLPIPEPTSLVLVSLMAGMLLRRR